MKGYSLYSAVRHAVMGTTQKRGDWVSVDTLTTAIARHLGERIDWQDVLGSIADMHDYGMATVRGSGIASEVRYDGILVYLNPTRKVAIVTDHGYAIGDWEYLLDPANAWRVERIPTWAISPRVTQ